MLTVVLLVIHDWPEEIEPENAVDKKLENVLNFRLIFSTGSDVFGNGWIVAARERCEVIGGTMGGTACQQSTLNIGELSPWISGWNRDLREWWRGRGWHPVLSNHTFASDWKEWWKIRGDCHVSRVSSTSPRSISRPILFIDNLISPQHFILSLIYIFFFILLIFITDF